MRILYLDCGMGAAGDMLLGALYSLLSEEKQKEFLASFREMGLSGVTLEICDAMKCGIAGKQAHIRIRGEEEAQAQEHQHTHRTLEDVLACIRDLRVSENVKKDVTAIYQKIAEAESLVHHTAVAEIHFHEVGMLDAIADVTGCAMLMEQLQIDKVIVSPVNVGYGTVKCAHGILPVPAPATAVLLEDLLCYGGDVKGELCTPTGAALLSYYGATSGKMPLMKLEKTGYGAGKKDFPAANVLRAMLGESKEEKQGIVEYNCNIDDMTGEEIGFAVERLLQEGALEVYTTSVGMKKNRPGILLTVLCREEDAEKMAEQIFLHTSTIGLRHRTWERKTLEREVEDVSFSLGQVNVKTSKGYGVAKKKAEYEDLKRIAQEKGMSLREVKDALYRETGI